MPLRVIFQTGQSILKWLALPGRARVTDPPMAWSAEKTDGTGKIWPLQILTQYEKGHGFTSILGHLWSGEKYPDRMADIGLHTTMIRSIEWLGRQDIIQLFIFNPNLVLNI